MITLWNILLLFTTLHPGAGQTLSEPKGKTDSLVREMVVYADNSLQKVVVDSALYREGWDTLAQVKFWHRVIGLTPDSSLLNNADTREVLYAFPREVYEVLNTDQRSAFKDSVIAHYQLPTETRLYVTDGKGDYYAFRETFDEIHTAIEVFEKEQVDPWYAQTILMIESPGPYRVSRVGAKGPFQLMKYVAKAAGISTVPGNDERENIDKAAMAAARWIDEICLPYARQFMNDYQIAYSEDDIWFRLLVMHIYHAGASNIRGVLREIQPREGGQTLIRNIWKTEYRSFRNASQNYTQIALAAWVAVGQIIDQECDLICEVETAPLSR